MEMPPCYYRVSVKALVTKNDKVLLTRENNGKWDLLGGGLDFGESFEIGLKREIFEESGLKIKKMSNQPVYSWTYENINYEGFLRRYLILLFRVELDSENFLENFTPSDECQELKFFSKEELKSLHTSATLEKFKELFNPEI
ncbi:MAG: NUDIX domain-containing protein [Nanoarchaeota archaeon]